MSGPMRQIKKTMTVRLTDEERIKLEALLPRAVGPMEGWVVTNAAQDRFRRWLNGAPTWTKDVAEATYYARRQDAEDVHEDDDGAWGVILVPLPPPRASNTQAPAGPAAEVAAQVCHAVREANACTHEHLTTLHTNRETRVEQCLACGEVVDSWEELAAPPQTEGEG